MGPKELRRRQQRPNIVRIGLPHVLEPKLVSFDSGDDKSRTADPADHVVIKVVSVVDFQDRAARWAPADLDAVITVAGDMIQQFSAVEPDEFVGDVWIELPSAVSPYFVNGVFRGHGWAIAAAGGHGRTDPYRAA